MQIQPFFFFYTISLLFRMLKTMNIQMCLSITPSICIIMFMHVLDFKTNKTGANTQTSTVVPKYPYISMYNEVKSPFRGSWQKQLYSYSLYIRFISNNVITVLLLSLLAAKLLQGLDKLKTFSGGCQEVHSGVHRTQISGLWVCLCVCFHKKINK